MAQKPRRPDAHDELGRERSRLDSVAGWYRTDSGFLERITWYSYVAIKPFFVGSSCLELGPAEGGMTRLLSHDFDVVTVVDASPDYVRSAEGQGSNIIGSVSLFEEFDPVETYDTIVMAHILEHVEDPVLVLRRARSWLSPAGRIIIVVPNAESLHRRLGVKLGMLEHVTQLNEQDIRIGHRRVYVRRELDMDIRAADLHVLTWGGIFLKLLSNQQMLMFDNDDLIDGLFELGRDLPELCSEIYAVCVAS